jgi:hypothetical protein
MEFRERDLLPSSGAKITEAILALQIMYQLQDSDYYISGFFVVGALVLLNLWLVSLIVAAVVKAFQSIRAEGKSGFGGEYVHMSDAIFATGGELNL